MAFSTLPSKHTNQSSTSGSGADGSNGHGYLPDRELLLVLYRHMLTARLIDKAEQSVTHRGEAFFHLSGSGHEGSAALAPLLTKDDWLHCHYRDRALLLARGVRLDTVFASLFCKDHSPSRGRGMSSFLSDPDLNILSMVTPTGNSALQAVGVAAAVRDRPGNPIVLCGMGDGTTQQGEVLEAFAEAARSQLPLLFLIEDNRYAISTETRGRTFWTIPGCNPHSFHGLPIRKVDGRDVVQAYRKLAPIVEDIRTSRKAVIVIFEVERLDSHTNADDHRIYRDQADLRKAAETGDPVRNLERYLISQGCSEATLEELHREVRGLVIEAEEAAYDSVDPMPTFDAKMKLCARMSDPDSHRRGESEGTPLVMKDALRDVLKNRLERDPRVFLYGEDIEDPKGDVFGVTKGLSTHFPGRVCNAPLSESTIMGSCIGRALAGQRPVAFLQFADFMPLAYNQIALELGAMHWRTDGGWRAPVIVMAACGGYRAGLGPYHGQTFESVLAHVPGVDVLMPATAADAAGMLNAAFESERPSIVLYPKKLLNDPKIVTPPDVDRQFVPIGCARKARAGRDLTFVGWGNTVLLCEKAADALAKTGIEAEVIDLRYISPWDQHMVLASVKKTRHLVVVHEDNLTCGLGAEIVATVAEKSRVPVMVRRVARPDTYVPCNFSNQIEVLPSFKRVLGVAAEMLDIDLSWIPPVRSESGFEFVEAIGSGPSDELVAVVEILCQPGQEIRRGEVVASLEATKSVFELTSPLAGIIEEVLATQGEMVPVGAPLLKVRSSQEARKKPVFQENPGTPVLKRRKNNASRTAQQRGERRALLVGLSGVATAPGSRVVSNEELMEGNQHRTSDDIKRRTGIENRHWIRDDESALGLSLTACRKLLQDEQLTVDDIDLVICSTTTPPSVTPSLACRILHGLSRGEQDALVQAYDINAACSGYLYALQAGYDYLQSTPNGRVLIVTAEVLSELIDINDFDTAILFGDAASATVLFGENHFDHAKAMLYRPDLSGKGEDGSTLSVPFRNNGAIRMKGQRVFNEAVRAMVGSLNRACQGMGMRVDDLSLVVPHQANQRIIDAIQNRVPTTIYSNIREYGNTSSSSIPLCLNEILPHLKAGDRIGLCAFGGGFTFGAGIIEGI